MHPDYFEGILQLRHPVLEVQRYVLQYQAQISKVKKEKNGFDYYFLSQKFLRKVGKELSSRFPGEFKTSRTLHTRSRQTGKEVYRVTVLFRCYRIAKGDTVSIRGIDYAVLALGKKVFVQNKKTKEKRWVSYDQLTLDSL
ncbi:MAG: NMD3-related protein [Candidatus Woesearchaeota archaeon]